MDASSGTAHGWYEQEVEEALREAGRPFMAEIDPNALHPARHWGFATTGQDTVNLFVVVLDDLLRAVLLCLLPRALI